MTNYPTWISRSSKTVVSEEQRDGVPDFAIVKEAKNDWRVSWRTSGHWSGPYPSLAAAKADVAASLSG